MTDFRFIAYKKSLTIITHEFAVATLPLFSLLSKVSIETEASGWFVGLCLLAGFVYAFILYSKKTNWSKNTNLLLSILRGVLVSLVAFLLLGPMLNQIKFFDEKPVIVLAVDNSASLPATYDSTDFMALKNQISTMAEELEASGLDVRVKGLADYSDDFQSVAFDQQATNLQSLLKGIERDYEQQNLVGVVLASDGIHNYGRSPQFMNLSMPVYAIGLGDTIPAMDLSIRSINYNKVVYEGNRFPLVVEVFNNGYVGQEVNVQVLKGGSVVKSESFSLLGDQQVNSVEFILDADKVGVENFQVQVVPLAGESSTVNNSRNAFLEVVDSKQRILIAGKAPHPDIKALTAVIDKNEGTETLLYLDGITDTAPEGPFDLVILHELPGFNTLPDWLNSWIDKTNTLFISGTNNLDQINQRNPVIDYSNYGQSDRVSANLNPNFELFEVDESLLSRMETYPPITVPYGQFSFKNAVEVMLYQRLGSVETDRPLISIFNSDDKKSAVFSGSGFWKWKLQEFALNDDQKLFEELFGKLIQYLATKDDKRNFQVGTTTSRYYDNESVEFISDVYNELFEKVYDYSIDLTITDESGARQDFDYVNSASRNFQVSGLAPGIYSYNASATVNGQRETSQGTFSVDRLALEDINLTANHQLLKNIANNSGGAYVEVSELDDITNLIAELNPRPIARSDEKLQLILNNPWLLILLLTLISGEWFIRKYNGSY